MKFPSPDVRILSHRSYAMAVRADDVAFAHFLEQRPGGSEHGSAGHQRKGLQFRISMVEVHLKGFEPASAVGAGNALQLAKHLDCAVLSNTNSVELKTSIPAVVRNVDIALAETTAVHTSMIELMFSLGW
jgi:hypothetical protein